MMNSVRSVNLTAVPECGVACLAEGLYHTLCSMSNQTCLCIDDSYNDWVTTCVTSNCTIKDQLSTQRATKLGCGATVTDNSAYFMLPESLVFGFSAIFILLRLLNRATRMAPWGWDDTTSVISWILCLGFLGVGVAEVKYEAGKPLWAKQPWQVDGALMIFFVSEVMYTFTLGMVKASILFLYERIFRSTSFQKLIWATQVFNLALVLAFVSSDFVQCRPLSYFWTSWYGESEGTCFNVNGFAYAHSGINIALDVWMILLPATQVWKLNMGLRQKLETTALFAVGIFLTAVTCVRLTTLTDFYKDPSDIATYYPVAIWTVVELNVGVIVSCMPAARLLVSKYASLLVTQLTTKKSSNQPVSYSIDSDPDSFKNQLLKKKRMNGRWWALPALPSGLGGTRFVGSVNAELEYGAAAAAMATTTTTRQGGDSLGSRAELVDVEAGEKMGV